MMSVSAQPWWMIFFTVFLIDIIQYFLLSLSFIIILSYRLWFFQLRHFFSFFRFFRSFLNRKLFPTSPSIFHVLKWLHEFVSRPTSCKVTFLMHKPWVNHVFTAHARDIRSLVDWNIVFEQLSHSWGQYRLSLLIFHDLNLNFYFIKQSN